jgi:hypothetical protein
MLGSGVKREFAIHGFGGCFHIGKRLGTFLNRQLEPIVRCTNAVGMARMRLRIEELLAVCKWYERLGQMGH